MFSQLLLDERGEAAIRDVLKLNERIFRFAQEDRCSKLASDRGIEIFDAVISMTIDFPRVQDCPSAQMQNRIRAIREG